MTAEPPRPSPDHAAPAPLAEVDRPYQEVNLLDVLMALLRRWKVLLGVPLIAAALAAIVVLLVPPAYSAQVSFVPEGRSDSPLPSNLASLAGQFGVNLGLGSSESPQFYAAVVRSRSISEAVLLSAYPDPTEDAAPGDSTTLLTLLEADGDTYADTLEDGVEELEDLVQVDLDQQTDVITLAVTTDYPGLSAAVANRYVELLEEFNARTRQSQAGERRAFAGRQLVEGEAALRQAENALRDFYEKNRTWQQSPQLVVEEGRLRRRVDGEQEVYVSLRREYERARIEEVNDTPVLTIIDRAVPPVEHSTPRRGRTVILVFIASLVGSVIYAFLADYLARLRREEPGAYAGLVTILREWRADAARTFRLRGRAP